MTNKKINWKEKAATLVGQKRAELSQWAHDAKILLVSNELKKAYDLGYTNGFNSAIKQSIEIECVYCTQCGFEEERFPDGVGEGQIDMNGRSCGFCGIGPMTTFK